MEICMSKILYAASTVSHIRNFHMPYINALRAEGHDVLIMASGEGADFDIPLEKKMLSKKNLSLVKQIKRILKRERFDVVVLNTALSAFYIRLAMPKKNRPRVVNIVHGYLFGSNTGFFKRNILLLCEKITKSKTDSVIVMNREDYRIAKYYSLSLGKVRSIHGMGAVVKPEGLSRKAVREEMKSEDAWVMLFVGELSARKNQKMLITALPEIRKTIKNAELWLVGDGDLRTDLAELAAKLGVIDYVKFAGVRDNPCDFIRAADVYVTASKIEGMPFNVIEALGCGATVFASDVKGHRDLIEDGVTGFLYPEDDISIFVSKLVAYKLGMFTVDEEDVLDKYDEYEIEAVFDNTYSVLKEEMKLDGKA